MTTMDIARSRRALPHSIGAHIVLAASQRFYAFRAKSARFSIHFHQQNTYRHISVISRFSQRDFHAAYKHRVIYRQHKPDISIFVRCHWRTFSYACSSLCHFLAEHRQYSPTKFHWPRREYLLSYQSYISLIASSDIILTHYKLFLNFLTIQGIPQLKITMPLVKLPILHNIISTSSPRV